MTPARRAAPAEVPGLAARRIAADIVDNVLRRRRPLDAELDGPEQHPGLAALPDRDRALVRKLVATVLRRVGTLRHLLGKFLESGFPKDAPRVETVLLIGAAQILFLDVPDHAAVDLSVRLVQADRRAAKYPGLVDAPCSSTGTIRRHPDVGWLKSEADLAQLVALQRRLLDHAVALTKP